MKAAFILVLICAIFGLVMLYEKKKAVRSNKHSKEAFWERERRANLTRRKDITFLNYITVPVDSLPFVDSVDPQINELQNQIKGLAETRILNLTGKTNTDLKLEYGAPNLTELTQYDENYLSLVNSLARLGEQLLFFKYTEEAIAFLEYGISIGSDNSKAFCLLAREYQKQNKPEEIDRLIGIASGNGSIMSASTVRKLSEIRAYCD